MDLDHNNMEVLSRTECLELLRTVPVGRVGLTSGALPVIVPVNFTVSDEDDGIVFRTGDGQKLHAALDGTVVAFQADSYDDRTKTAWSVLIQGFATVHPVGPPNGRTFPDVDTWAGIEPTHVVVLSTDQISGRRILPSEDRPRQMAGT